MRRSPWPRAVFGAAVSLALLAAAVVPGRADPEVPDPEQSAISHDAATTTESAAAVSAFWTADRMREAVPMDLLTVDVPPGKQHLMDDIPLADATKSLPNNGSPWTGGGEVVKTAGRVFFTYQGRQASCSGNAVTSTNKSVVITAGHCVRMAGNWHPDWVFAPGYDNGNTPHGKWTARQLLATPQWIQGEELNFDVGAAVVNQLDGKSLTDVVGGQEIAFDQPRGQDMYSFGYPAAAPYDGKRLIYCSGKAFNDFLFSTDLGLSCNQTGGASGGPWLLKFDEATGKGVQNSVNSFKYRLLNFWMFGPYFGTEAQAVYDTAQKS